MPMTTFTSWHRPGIIVVSLLLLAACESLPRGAGVTSEVLATSTAEGRSATDDALPTDFAVEAITRDKLGIYAGWPAQSQGRSYSWPRGQGRQAKAINPGDTVNISIWLNEENSLLTNPGQRVVELAPMVVSPSGGVFLPYVGQIDLAGQGQDQARETIQAAYVKIAPSAQVQLRSVEGRQSSVSVVDGVEKPGSFPLADSSVTVLDMLALSGGVHPRIDNPQVRLQRGDTTYGISLDRIMEDTELNVGVRGNDRIFVESDDRYFLSLGATGTQAQHNFPQDQLTAIDALALIGGLSEASADAKGILILRGYDAGDVRSDGTGPRHVRTIFTIDLTSADGLFSAGEFRVQPGDLIYVTESPLIGTRNFLGVVAAIFGITNQVGNILD
jgi:polysaccharide export outer membrane protein